jgi:hypothetical protein
MVAPRLVLLVAARLGLGVAAPPAHADPICGEQTIDQDGVVQP